MEKLKAHLTVFLIAAVFGLGAWFVIKLLIWVMP